MWIFTDRLSRTRQFVKIIATRVEFSLEDAVELFISSNVKEFRFAFADWMTLRIFISRVALYELAVFALWWDEMIWFLSQLICRPIPLFSINSIEGKLLGRYYTEHKGQDLGWVLGLKALWRHLERIQRVMWPFLYAKVRCFSANDLPFFCFRPTEDLLKDAI